MSLPQESGNKTQERLMAELKSLPKLVWKVLDTCMESFLFIDKSFKIQIFNRRAAERAKLITGREMQLGDSIFLFTTEEEKDTFKQHFSRALHGDVVSVVKEIQRLGQPSLWFESHYTAVTDDSGKVMGVSLTTVDITDFKKAETASIKSEQNLRAIFDASAVGIVLADTNGVVIHSNPAMQQALGFSADELRGQNLNEIKHLRRITENSLDLIAQTDLGGIIQYVSPSHERILGYEPEEMLGKSIYDFMRSDHIDHVKAAILQAQSTLQPWKMEVRCRCADGRYIWLESIGKVMPNSNGKISGVVLGSRDITERKKAEADLQKDNEKLHSTFEQTINALVLTLGKRDPFTTGHQQRVTKLSVAIAEELGLPQQQIEGIRLAGLLHDIGKILVPVELLSKPSKLTGAESDIVKTHPKGGYEILQSIEFPWPIAQIVLQHHENMDGSGYPQGLKGEDILLEARILGVADVVEAMSSHRPYRPELGLEAAAEEITNNRGVKYDPQVVDVCLRLIREKDFKFE
jgi:PAS domain S-box-containing protein/putative nucleotidyltransferase with HDIG domain